MSANTTHDQERTGGEPLTVEEIAVESTRELLREYEKEACEPVHEIASGLSLLIEDLDYLVVDEPTESQVVETAQRLRDLAEFLEVRVMPLLNE